MPSLGIRCGSKTPAETTLNKQRLLLLVLFVVAVAVAVAVAVVVGVGVVVVCCCLLLFAVATLACCCHCCLLDCCWLLVGCWLFTPNGAKERAQALLLHFLISHNSGSVPASQPTLLKMLGHDSIPLVVTDMMTIIATTPTCG